MDNNKETRCFDFKLLAPVLAALVFFSPMIYLICRDGMKPEISPEVFMGDRVVKVERVAMDSRWIFTSRDGKMAETRDFKTWKWIQR